MADNQPTPPIIGATRSPVEAAQSAPEPAVCARIPVATYRLQFNADFTFKAATALVPYLHDLGISDIYVSPIFKARSSSSHGYDVCDPTQLNPQLGSEEDFEALVAALHERQMGLLLDTVPNHMGIGDVCNTWWLDVLENGPSSPYAAFFDIDWHPIKPEFQNKVLLPVLEDQYGAVLESGKLLLTYEDGAFYIQYHDLKLPVAPGTYRIILDACLARLLPLVDESDDRSRGQWDTGQIPVTEPGVAPGVLSENQDILELQSILTAVNHLPSRNETDRQRVYERYREKEIIKRRLATLSAGEGEAGAALQATLTEFNGQAGDPHSFDLLDQLMDTQVFRLAFWQVAGEEINYRRFFDINDLAAVRVEVAEVFQATHQLVLRLLKEGKADGLRIDHPDGLWDPATYFRRLQESYVESLQPSQKGEAQDHGPLAAERAAPDARPRNEPESLHQSRDWQTKLPVYVVAEKILSEREPLPLDWAVHGTTGYDFMAAVNNIMVQAGQREVFDRIYSEFTGQQTTLEELTTACKLLIMRDSLASEINSLSHQLERIGERNRHYRDFTLNGITSALREVIACLPVYRTYINAVTSEVPERDQEVIKMAVRMARRRRPGLAGAIFNFIQDTLLLRNIQHFKPADQAELANFVMKFQQLSGPVMAKGVEDTAFYIYNRLVALNEVGNNPDQFGISVADFHRDNTRRNQRWPHSLLATSTHDNKRSEDVRARIDVLSEMPETWRTALARWGRLNNAMKTMVDGHLAPDRNDEYLLYQTLLGTWPIGRGEWHAADTLRAEAAASGGRDGDTMAALASDPLSATGDGAVAEGLAAAAPASRDGRWAFLLPPADPEFGAYRERILAYVQKAAREAKVHTSWLNPDAEYDQALRVFTERALDGVENQRFLEELALLARRVAYFGQFNSLTQALLKLTCPGVPDIYQGQEMWAWHLVDPDNRRPVDHDCHRGQLTQLQEQMQKSPDGKLLDLTADLLRRSYDGRIKLFVTACALAFRQTHAGLFAEGSYIPLPAQGAKADHVCAFARQVGAQRALVVAPRLLVGLTDGNEQAPLGVEVWGDTWLGLPGDFAGQRYRQIFTGETLQVGTLDHQSGVQLASVLEHFPVALLEKLPAVDSR